MKETEKNQDVDITQLKKSSQPPRGEPNGEENDHGSGEVSLDPEELDNNQ